VKYNNIKYQFNIMVFYLYKMPFIPVM